MKKSKLPIIILVLLFLIVVAVLVLAIFNKKTETEAKNNTETVVETESDSKKPEDFDRYVEKWAEGVITYNGKNYEFNQNLSVYLLMGIDKEGPVEKSEDYTKGGQSDANFLLVANKLTDELSVFSINRNTLTEVTVYNAEGDELGEYLRQLCLQHGYGDGAKLSCNMCVEAVSKLFYNIPIDGYMSMNMGAIPGLNDSVGGVEVEVLEGARDLEVGTTVNLNGEQAYWYLRGRDTTVFDSSTLRLRRQEQYVSNFLDKVKDRSNYGVGVAMNMYDALKEYLVTNVDFEAIVTELLNYEYSPERMYTIPGHTEYDENEKFEQYIVDEDAFYDQVIQVFYVEVE